MFIKKLLQAGLCVALIWPLIGMAQPPYPHHQGYGPRHPPYPPLQRPEPRQQANPASLVREGLDKLLSVTAKLEQGANPGMLLSGLRNAITPYFDFNYMADWVAGPYKRQMNPTQKQAFAAKLEQMFLKALARRLTGGEGYSYQMLPPRGNSRDRETVVSVRVFQYQRPLTQVDFRMYWDGEQWKVFDVLADNRSAIQYYRRYFNEQVARGGLGLLLGN